MILKDDYSVLLVGILALCFLVSRTEPAQAIENPEETHIQPKLQSVELPATPGNDLKFSNTEPSAQVIRRGWDHLFRRLVFEGIHPERAEAVLVDKRMPSFRSIVFSLNPKESHYAYRKHNTPKNRLNALKFYRQYQDIFKQAQQMFFVEQSVILAILQIESFCGKNTGKQRVLPALARLASAAAPENLEINIRDKTSKDRAVRPQDVTRRATYLELTFLPHVVGTFTAAQDLGIDPLELRGSGGGAIGYPQFLPGNVRKFGVDGNNDGKLDVFHPEDAILSVAKFLSSYGWDARKKMSAADKHAVIWEYNRSRPYIETVLSMANQLDAGIKTASSTAPQSPKLKRILKN